MINMDTDIEECLRVLHDGGLILYPTDTIWGIGCDATNTKAVQKVFEVKKRPDEKALIVLVADEQDIIRHTASPDLALFDHLKKTDKPTTVIYDGAIGLAPNLIAKDGSVGIRICRDPFCRKLIRRFRKPLVSTSANIAGENFPASYFQISPKIIDNVDYVVNHRREETTLFAPSAIIRWKNGAPEIIRQ
jgi:L-threonylcarbamoyladenylate synthase